jgi:hypothetical protein
MDCSDFLDSYSDFRDGRITDVRRLRRLHYHLGHCGPCSRYDASVRHGVGALGEIDPSPDFRRRLRARIAARDDRPLYHDDQPMNHFGTGAGIAAALMLAAAVALLVYSGSDTLTPSSVAASTVVADVPPPSASPEPPRAYPMVVVNPGVPFVTFTDLSISPFRNAGATTGAEFHVHSDIPLGAWANLPR